MSCTNEKLGNDETRDKDSKLFYVENNILMTPHV